MKGLWGSIKSFCRVTPLKMFLDADFFDKLRLNVLSLT